MRIKQFRKPLKLEDALKGNIIIDILVFILL